MTETIKGYCICSEEMCFCSELIDLPVTLPPPDIACDECERGFHVWGPGEERDYSGAEYIGPPQ